MKGNFHIETKKNGELLPRFEFSSTNKHTADEVVKTLSALGLDKIRVSKKVYYRIRVCNFENVKRLYDYLKLEKNIDLEKVFNLKELGL